MYPDADKYIKSSPKILDLNSISLPISNSIRKKNSGGVENLITTYFVSDVNNFENIILLNPLNNFILHLRTQSLWRFIHLILYMVSQS